MKIEDLLVADDKNVMSYNKLVRLCQKHNIDSKELNLYINKVGAELKWQSLRNRCKNVIGLKLKEENNGGNI